jgi:putative flavoprotein involved in K+ transport
MSSRQATQLIEEGAAAMQLAGRKPGNAPRECESYDVIVIGGGQAGLSVGYHLARAGLRFIILDANRHVGDSWRNRWDSLRLFTSARFNGLDGMPFPAPRNYFPTKDEMADYLGEYASRFQLPVRNGVRVNRLWARNQRYVVTAGDVEFEAPQVVVAMARYQQAKWPEFSGELPDRIVQLHANDYRNARQLRRGGVLVVGAGNSGADIALEVAAAGHEAWVAGEEVSQIPFRPESFLGRNLLQPLVLGVVFMHVLTVNTRLGRKARQGALTRAAPRIRVKRSDLAAAGIERVPRVVGVRSGAPLLADGRTIDVNNVIWCTGFHPGFDWIELPVFGSDGGPMHRSGVVESHPGLYFVGLPFLHSMSSSMVHGVGRDAARIVEAIRRRHGC